MPNLEDGQAFIAETGTVASKLQLAHDMVMQLVGDAYVPESAINEATYELAQELFQRQKSPGGFAQFGGSEVVGRLARDPMESIRPILRPWLIPFS